MNILGISCFYHESAAALIRDGKIVAACAEERFSRKKHDASYPQMAIDFCLNQQKITSKKLDYVVFYENPFRKFERNLIMSLKHFPHSRLLFVDSMKNFLSEKIWIKSIIKTKLGIRGKKILFIPHHISHAAASYYPSPFKEAAYLTLDGVGEWSTGSWGYAKGIKLYPKGELIFPHSLGLLYSAFTAFLGFRVNDGEYKIMGMVAYGKPIHIDRVKRLYRQHSDGSISLNLEYFSFQYSTKRMYSAKFEDLFQGLNKPDIAASIQSCTENIVFSMLNEIYKKTKQKNLIFGGGVALNSTLNGKITKNTPFQKVFIFPAAGDDGGCVGAALYTYHHVLKHNNRERLSHVFLGQEFSQKYIELMLKKKNISYKKMTQSRLLDYVSGNLAKGKVLAWYEGRTEFGPRALGHRSILADPRSPDMKDIVNTKIKFREKFRPFAPVVLKEYVQDYFYLTTPLLSSFMLSTTKAKSLAKKQAPSVVHDDGTSRIQVVDKYYQGLLYMLLKKFYEKTSVPILMNTSFNVKGEPIVNSPEDAIRTFYNSGIDFLVIENILIGKK